MGAFLNALMIGNSELAEPKLKFRNGEPTKKSLLTLMRHCGAYQWHFSGITGSVQIIHNSDRQMEPVLAYLDRHKVKYDFKSYDPKSCENGRIKFL